MIVEHQRYGRGVVKDVRHRGIVLKVAFDLGFERSVRREDLVFVELPSLSQPPASPVAQLIDCRSEERTIIEALRLGIVPHGHIGGFTFGREQEIEDIKRWLVDRDDASFRIIGEYGAGKTHLLDYMYNIAINEGFAVARVELDPNEASLHSPKKVYRRLISSFQYRDANEQTGDFRDFMRDVARESYELRDRHRYLGVVVDMLRRGRNDESVWEWIEGHGSALKPTLYDYGTAANIYCNILTALGWSAVQAIGLKGLILLIDEMETIDMSSYSYQIEYVHNFISGLIQAVYSAPKLLSEKVELRRHRLYEYRRSFHGRETNLYYPKHAKNVRFLYRRPSCTKLVMAFTPNPILEDIDHKVAVAYDSHARLHIEPLSHQALRNAFGYICSLYQQAYGFVLPSNISEAILSTVLGKRDSGSSARGFFKTSVEALDILRFHGTDRIEDVLR